jgi:VWFA-related protein
MPRNHKVFLAVLATLLFPVVSFCQSPEPETIRIESDLVDLKVGVVSTNPQQASPQLQQKDFVVFEDGQPQEISFFASADTPFDLVLLLDLSGSTKDKLKLVRKSAKRFVDLTRPIDRVSVVTFAETTEVVCPLTSDRTVLKKKIDKIEEPAGGTKFWDALHYVLAIFRASHNELRRSAVVAMTDGVDNALPGVFGDGSATSFDDLLNFATTSQTLVFPIYLDTETEGLRRMPGARQAYDIARNQLSQLAAASGTTPYRADKLEDLDKVYAQVIGDLGRIYSIGYSPSNHARDGKWRSVRVQIIDRQDVIARTKQGYFARSAGPE